MHTDPSEDLLRFEWPRGTTLCIVQRAALTGDDPVICEFIGQTPDTVPPEWGLETE